MGDLRSLPWTMNKVPKKLLIISMEQFWREKGYRYGDDKLDLLLWIHKQTSKKYMLQLWKNKGEKSWPQMIKLAWVIHQSQNRKSSNGCSKSIPFLLYSFRVIRMYS